jgi:hypothetical protein
MPSETASANRPGTGSDDRDTELAWEVRAFRLEGYQAVVIGFRNALGQLRLATTLDCAHEVRDVLTELADRVDDINDSSGGEPN